MKQFGLLALFCSETPQPNRIGHNVISCGNGRQTVEAKDTKSGVIVGDIDRAHRGWEFGIRIPSAGEWTKLTANASKPENWFLRPTAPSPEDTRVKVVQEKLRGSGFPINKLDGIFSSQLSKVVAKFQAKNGLVVDGMVGRQTSKSLGIDWPKAVAGSGTYNAKCNVFFNSFVDKGFYSSDPDNLRVKRSIRTNNPGALNITNWQRSMKGFVGVTPPDNSPDANRTTIYRTPEHGVAAWFELLARRYGFETQGQFTLVQLARRYAGSEASERAVQTYVKGWSKASGSVFTAETTFRVGNNDELLSLGQAMFTHEIGTATPLKANQIVFGISKQRSLAMPD